ncbi:MAG TPA: hypothetical protein VKL40_15475 [Candidatus Angelobacter sp.]|nr:hypothetical protein [Candidatus Angelobacter sp.]
MREFSMNRRRFTIAAAAAATTAILRPDQALSQNATPASAPAQSQTPTPGSLEEQTQAALAKLSPQGRAEVEMKIAEIFRKYGDKLSAAQKADIRKVMAEGQEGLEKMRAFVVENSEQPATVFQIYRKDGKK